MPLFVLRFALRAFYALPMHDFTLLCPRTSLLSQSLPLLISAIRCHCTALPLLAFAPQYYACQCRHRTIRTLLCPCSANHTQHRSALAIISLLRLCNSKHYFVEAIPNPAITVPTYASANQFFTLPLPDKHCQTKPLQIMTKPLLCVTYLFHDFTRLSPDDSLPSITITIVHSTFPMLHFTVHCRCNSLRSTLCKASAFHIRSMPMQGVTLLSLCVFNELPCEATERTVSPLSDTVESSIVQPIGYTVYQ